MIREALETYHLKVEKDRAPNEPLRLLVKQALGRKYHLYERIFEHWLGVDLGEDRCLEEALGSFIQSEVLRQMAEQLASAVDGGPSVAPSEVLRTLRGLVSAFERGRSVVEYADAGSDYLHNLREGRIPTGLARLDAALWGGLGGGELGLILAPAKGGKTACLVNLGAAAVLAGKRVLHLSMEIRRSMCLLRYDMRIGGYTQGELERNPRLIAKARKKVPVGGRLLLWDASHEKVSPNRLEGFLANLEQAPELLVVDYADLMKSDQRYGGESGGRFELKEIYQELRRIAAAMEIPLWTASQSNRESGRSGEPEVWDVSEDISKVQTADFVLCVQQTAHQKRQGRMNLVVGATRMSSQNETIPVEVDYDRMVLYDHAGEEKR